MDYYKILDCSKDSTQEEIKRAYHQRLLQFHPDKTATAETRRFHNVQEAWRILGHSQSRRQYDAACKQEELESSDEDGLVYATLSPDDLEESIFDTLFYRCRCGDKYFVEPEDLPKKNNTLQVTCNGCTLIIIIKA